MSDKSVVACLDELEAQVRSLADESLAPVELPWDFAERRAQWAGRDVMLQTHMWNDPRGRTNVRIARGRGALESLTAVVFGPRHDSLLGLDIVAFATRPDEGPRLVAIVADVQGVTSVGQLQRLRMAYARASHLGRMRDWSDTGASPFGTLGFIASPREPDPGPWAEVCAEYIEGFRPSIEPGNPKGPVPLALRAYLAALSDSKKQLKVLGKLFGEDWTREYFDGVFFQTRGL